MAVTMEIDAIVLAGGNAGGLDDAVPCKGLVPICDRPMVEYVIDALRKSSLIRNIVVVLPDAGKGEWQRKVDQVVINYGNIVDNFLAAVDALPQAEYVLTMSGDMPLISAAAVDDYLTKCEPFDSDMYYPIVRRADVESRFPGTERTYIHLRDGTFTGGNMGLCRPSIIVANRALMDSVFEVRKSPLRLLRILGLGFIFKFLFRRLTIEELERKISDVISGKGKAVIVACPEVGFDVDKPSDLSLATEFLCGEAS